MGSWYVIANIPTFIEKNAYNAVETYSLNEDGTVATTFRFREGSINGEEKTYHPTGYVLDNKSNAVWGMQFVWPIKADYRIAYLSDDYGRTIIGRTKRDYVWLMAREPVLPEAQYQAALQVITQAGYDTGKLQLVPQEPRL